MNALALQFQENAFDAVILNLILGVVPDGAATLMEGPRVLRPGGRMVIYDKFLNESSQLSTFRRILGCIIGSFGTDPNRRLSDILGQAPGLVVDCNETSLLRGQYSIILIHKKA